MNECKCLPIEMCINTYFRFLGFTEGVRLYLSVHPDEFVKIVERFSFKILRFVGSAEELNELYKSSKTEFINYFNSNIPVSYKELKRDSENTKKLYGEEYSLIISYNCYENDIFSAVASLRSFANDLKEILSDEHSNEVDKVYKEISNKLIESSLDDRKSLKELFHLAKQEFLEYFNPLLSDNISYSFLKYNRSLILNSIEQSYKNNPSVKITTETYNRIINSIKTECSITKLYEWKSLYFSHIN